MAILNSNNNNNNNNNNSKGKRLQKKSELEINLSLKRFLRSCSSLAMSAAVFIGKNCLMPG